ncbi:MAG: hypothetical protein WC881_03585 [Elusimicrobiota bacterium]|jgi:hypothetical protein
MKGIWVHLDISSLQDARAAAREFERRYPAQILSADIKVSVQVMNIKTS